MKRKMLTEQEKNDEIQFIRSLDNSTLIEYLIVVRENYNEGNNWFTSMKIKQELLKRMRNA